MADTYTYAGGAKAFVIITTQSTDSTAVLSTARLDDFSVVCDYPTEQIAPVGSSLGDAGSAGIVFYSGSFNARLLVKGKPATGASPGAGHRFLLGSSNAAIPTPIEFCPSSKDKYYGPVILSNMSIDAAGGSVVKFSGSWQGCDTFAYSTV